MKKAYDNINNFHYDKNSDTLFIAGTKNISDIKTDLLIPIHKLKSSARYKQFETLQKLYNAKNIVGHSLGAQIVKEYTDDKPNINAFLYNSPSMDDPRPNQIYYRHYIDPVSWFNSDTAITTFNINPHSYRGY